MNGTPGRSVRLYLVDGSPTGVVTAEIMNWTGHVLAAPRSKIADALRREEAQRTGVYCLIGDDPEQPSKERVYVGEGDCVADRIKAHVKDESKDFWTRACVITSKDTNLTKAHVRYLERRLLDLTNAADRANLANGNEPALKSLPESDVADMEFFLAQIQVVLPVVGIDFLRDHARPSEESVAQPSSSDGVELHLKSDLHGIEAWASERDGEVTVFSGSTASTKEDFANNTYAALRGQLIADGRLKLSEDGSVYLFSDDVFFKSPSAAAAVIFNRNANGRESWKLKGSSMTLKEWQDSGLEGVDAA